MPRTLESQLAQVDRLKAVMSAIGFAIWQVQELENTAATYLVVRVRGQRGMGSEAGEQLLERAERQTLGSMVRDLARAGVLEGQVAEQLGSLVEERNWFVHRARRETRGLLGKPSTYDEVMVRAERLADAALALMKLLTKDLQAFVVASGIDPAKIDDEANRLARAWGFR